MGLRTLSHTQTIPQHTPPIKAWAHIHKHKGFMVAMLKQHSMHAGGIVNNTLRPMIPGYCDPEWRRLMEECWAPNPMARPSFTEIASRLRVMSSMASQTKAQVHKASKWWNLVCSLKFPSSIIIKTHKILFIQLYTKPQYVLYLWQRYKLFFFLPWILRLNETFSSYYKWENNFFFFSSSLKGGDTVHGCLWLFIIIQKGCYFDLHLLVFVYFLLVPDHLSVEIELVYTFLSRSGRINVSAIVCFHSFRETN